MEIKENDINVISKLFFNKKKNIKVQDFNKTTNYSKKNKSKENFCVSLDEVFNLYRYSKSLIISIDNLVEMNALNSFYSYKNNSKSTLDVYNDITNLMEKKIDILNFRVIFKKCFKFLDEKSRKILKLKYFNKIKCEEIAKLLKLSNRTYFRRLEKAEVNFINLLKNYKILF